MSFEEKLMQAEERLQKVHEVAERLADEWFKGLDPVSFRITVIAITRDLIALMTK